MRSPDPQPSAAALVEIAYGGVTDLVESASEDDLRAPTRTAWTRVELLFHLLLDAQRVLTTLASPAIRDPDTDALTYWRRAGGEDDGGPAEAHVAYVRRAAAAYTSPRGVVAHWVGTAGPAVRAALRADARDRVETQGHVITVGDFLSTVVVEATVHHLDLRAGGPDRSPSTAALRHTRQVLDRLLGRPLPPSWSDEQAVLIGTGRAPAPAGLDDLATRLPLLH